MIQRICQQCGKIYETFPSINLQFCNQKCYDESRKKRIVFNCAFCGKESWHYPSKPKKYCNRSCACLARNHSPDNPAYHRDISGKNNPMYGKGLSGSDNPMYGKTGEKNPNWKGGKKRRKDGYVLVIAPPGHPYPADTSSGTPYILEHRLVMERHLRRYLKPGEVVHHIDENPSNNEISNLRLYSSQSEHIKDAHSKSPPNRSTSS